MSWLYSRVWKLPLFPDLDWCGIVKLWKVNTFTARSKSALFVAKVSRREIRTPPPTLLNTARTLVEIRPEPNTKKFHVGNAGNSSSQGEMGICFAQRSVPHNTKKKITNHLARLLQTKKLLNFAVGRYTGVCGSKPTQPHRFWATPPKILKAI